MIGSLWFNALTTNASAYELISTTVLGSNAASVTFSSLPSTYKHFQIRMTSRSTTAANEDNLRLRFNGDTGSNYHYHLLYGDGATTASSEVGPTTYIQPGSVVGSTFTSSAFGGNVIDILDALNTNKNTTIKASAGFTGTINRIMLYSGVWVNTAAITSIELSSNASLVTGSRFSLYGYKG